jgi:hypothetical protein
MVTDILDIMLCNLVDIYHRFGEHQLTSTKLHGVACQKTISLFYHLSHLPTIDIKLIYMEIIVLRYITQSCLLDVYQRLYPSLSSATNK